jgi:hypothetical protein
MMVSVRFLGRGRRRQAESDVTAELSEVLGQPVAYNHLQYGAGALSGVIDLPDVAAYRLAMTTAYARLSDLLGDDVDRVVFYLSAVTPDGTLDATALGLPVQPTGRDVARLA